MTAPRYNLRHRVRPFSLERLELSDAGLVPRYVRIGRSRLVSGGRGLFATRALPAKAALTGYPGPRVPKGGVKTRSQRNRTKELSWYMYEPGGADYYLQPSPDDLSSGLAHMANDAVHPEATGRMNNCEFCETDTGRVYLQTVRPVRAGEELLVDYMLPYWIDRVQSATSPPLPPRLKRMLQRIGRVQGLVKPFDVGVVEYLGGNVLRVKDCNQRMYCQCNHNDNHNDNDNSLSAYKNVVVEANLTLSCHECESTIFYA